MQTNLQPTAHQMPQFSLSHTLSPHTAALSSPNFLTPPTILIVEDDAAMRRYMEVILRRAGFQVVSAEDGAQALEIALSPFSASSIDAVITDAMLPYLDGRELCARLRAHPATAHIPTILLSGLWLKKDAQLEAVDFVFAKPVDAAKLTACLRQLTSTHARHANAA